MFQRAFLFLLSPENSPNSVCTAPSPSSLYYALLTSPLLSPSFLSSEASPRSSLQETKQYEIYIYHTSNLLRLILHSRAETHWWSPVSSFHSWRNKGIHGVSDLLRIPQPDNVRARTDPRSLSHRLVLFLVSSPPVFPLTFTCSFLKQSWVGNNAWSACSCYLVVVVAMCIRHGTEGNTTRFPRCEEDKDVCQQWCSEHSRGPTHQDTQP